MLVLDNFQALISIWVEKNKRGSYKLNGFFPIHFRFEAMCPFSSLQTYFIIEMSDIEVLSIEAVSSSPNNIDRFYQSIFELNIP